jgi:hypothetical protein
VPRVTYVFQGVGDDRVKSQFEGVDKAADKSAANAERRSKKLRRNRAKNRLKRIRESKRSAAREAQAEERAQSSADQKSERRAKKLHRNRAKRRLQRMRERRRELAQVEKTERKKAEAVKRAEDKARKSRSERRGRFAAGVGRAALGFAASGMAAGAAVGGAAIRQSLTLQQKARQIAIQGRKPGEAIDPSALRASFEATATRVTGTKAADVAEGVGAFVSKTGRLDLASEFQDVFAEVASATSSDLTDVATAAADLMEKFDIKSISQMEEALAAMTFQGKAGAFELKDAAGQFARLSAAAQTLGIGKGVEQVKILGGITQIARRATGGPEEAATAVESMFSQMTLKSDKLKREGVNVFHQEGEKKGQARDIRDVLAETVGQVGGENLEEKKQKLGQIFGKRGIRALAPLIDAYASATGTAAQKQQAVADALNDAIDAPGNYADVLQDAAVMQQDAGAQITAAWESIVATMGTEAAPAIAELVGAMASFLKTTDAASALATVFVALAEAVGLAMKGLEALGIVEKKNETPADTMKRVERERSRVRSRREGLEDQRQRLWDKQRSGGLSEREFDKVASLDEQIGKLTSEEAKLTKQFDESKGEAFKPAAEVFQDFSHQGFQDKFLAARGLTDEDYLSSAQEGVDPNAQISGGTEAQQQLVEQLRQSLAAQQTGQGAPGLEDAITPTNVAIQGLGTVAAEVAKKLATIEATKRADIGG